MKHKDAFIILALVHTLLMAEAARFYCGEEGHLNHPDVIHGDFMVRMKASMDDESLHQTLKSSLKSGYKVHNVYSSTKLLHLTMNNNDTIDRLLQNNDVVVVECDRLIHVAGSQKVVNKDAIPKVESYLFQDSRKRSTVQPPSWGLDRINQRLLPLDNKWGYSSHTGTGVHVFVIDTGIDSDHPEFTGRLSDGYNAVRSWKRRNPAWEDGNGHGTHCAGTIGGTVYGVAPNVTLHAVRVIGDRGSGTLSGVVNGIDWVVEYHKAHTHPSVASMSLGGNYSPSINAAVHDAIRAGVVFVVAAGNEATDACNTSPASANGVISVSATANDDSVPSWANYGDCVDVYAPGHSISSAWPRNRVATISGTSMACPHVSGGIALYLEKHPDSNVSYIREHVLKYSTPEVILSRDEARLFYIGPGFIHSPTDATHEPPSSVVPTCSGRSSACSKNTDCCSGRCWRFRRVCF